MHANIQHANSSNNSMRMQHADKPRGSIKRASSYENTKQIIGRCSARPQNLIMTQQIWLEQNRLQYRAQNLLYQEHRRKRKNVCTIYTTIVQAD